MPRLTEIQKTKLLADYHAGVNKNQLALKYELSPVAVGKICKGITPKNAEKVNTLINVAIGLEGQSSYELESINRQVSQKVADFDFFRSASMIVAKKAVEKVKNENLSMFDLEKAQSVIGKGKENIYGKMPETAVQINNQQTTYGWESDNE
jgi:DNA-binding Lrp family transcriptional regulator